MYNLQYYGENITYNRKKIEIILVIDKNQDSGIYYIFSLFFGSTRV